MFALFLDDFLSLEDDLKTKTTTKNIIYVRNIIWKSPAKSIQKIMQV